MSEKPILFSGAMVRAILDGRKTQTRRIVKHIPALGYPEDWCERAAGIVDMVGDYRRFCPYGQPGDRLWVREAYALLADPGSMRSWDGPIPDERPTLERTQLGHIPTPIYRCDGERSDVTSQLGRKLRWRPGIHMPRWASRISLEVKAVRVERLHDISEADAEAEGVDPRGDGSARYRAAFRLLWCEIYGHASWDANPWLWCVSFARVRP